MQSSYPIFESGQVLTSRHLNDIVEYFESQDRLTRAKLIGAGIACGLDVSFSVSNRHVQITGGCAVTSAGYLIVLEPSVLDRARPYKVPVPIAEGDEQPSVGEARYPFFFDADEQIDIWELLATGYQPRPGEEPPTELSADFVNDKVALLFLECNRQSLRNCDINDCSDKGTEMEFTPRILMVAKDEAELMLAREADVQAVPVDRRNHPRFELKPLTVPKLNPSNHNLDTFAELYERITRIAEESTKHLLDALNAAFYAYRYLLDEVYPRDRFPNGPFGDGYLASVLNEVSNNAYLVQYLYDFVRDAVASHNEFLDAAAEFDADCCLDEDRFPKHVLLGGIAHRPTAFAPELKLDGSSTVDPLTANSGYGPTTRPAGYRHHFIAAMTGACANSRLSALRSIHYRTYLLAYRFRLDGLTRQPIRITPSKNGAAALSDTAIPFYYGFGEGDDLHRNWSFSKTVKNHLYQVYSHGLIDEAKHPLVDRMDDHDFYRVEGVVGKSLGEVLESLIHKKRKLGLAFGIEPVYIGLNVENDKESLELNRQSQALATKALNRLFFCRMRELDVVFLILMSTLFFYLYAIIERLAGGNTAAIGGLRLAARKTATGTQPRGSLLASVAATAAPPNALKRNSAEAVLREIRLSAYAKGDLTRRVTKSADITDSVGMFYQQIKDDSVDNLYDRTMQFADKVAADFDANEFSQRVYPTVSLLDKAEQLIETVSAPSIGEFDFELFEQRYEGFTAAFDSFKAQADAADEPTDSKVAMLRQAVMQNYAAVAATTPQAVIGNLLAEFQHRLAGLFEQLTMTKYGPRHPGLVHKAGVASGGTLVLLYTHDELLQKSVNANRDSLRVGLTAEQNVALEASMQPKANVELSVEASRSRDGQPLNQFVVLADFCLPYLCCVSDCSDIALAPIEDEPPKTEPPKTEPPKTEPPTPDEPVIDSRRLITIRGTVLGSPTRPGATMRPLTSATLHVVNVDTNEEIKTMIDDGDFEFSVPPGTYRVQSEASRTFVPMDTIFKVTPATPAQKDFILQRK